MNPEFLQNSTYVNDSYYLFGTTDQSWKKYDVEQLMLQNQL